MYAIRSYYGACTSPQFRISVGVDVDIETVSNTTAVSCFGGNDGSITLVDVKGGSAWRSGVTPRSPASRVTGSPGSSRIV